MDSSCSELPKTPQMLPPAPGTFVDREALIEYVGEFGVSQGYVVTIKQSKKDKIVTLGCDRGGVCRSKRKPDGETSGERSRKKSGSRRTNCPFELVGKKDDGVWILMVKNGSHNHEPLKDIKEHPSASRFTEKEVMQIKEMNESGLKPRQILKRLRQSNPELLSTPKHLYNVKAKLRQGNLTVKRLKTLSHKKPTEGNLQYSTSTNEPSWKRRYPLKVPNFIGGKFVESQSSTSIDVINPATQKVVSQVPVSTYEEFKAAVFAAKHASLSWRNTPLTARQRVMFRFQELIQRDIEKIALSITTEQGKTLKDARHDVLRGLEAVEQACVTTSLPMGDFVPNIRSETDTYSIREPLGICAGICPSNFPGMVPLWMFPIAVTCGNTFILKPSERDSAACLTLAELGTEAGLPNGVLNVIHGTNDIINAICDGDEIKAVSFVGPDTVGMYVNARASANGRHVQSNAGAKNHAIVMPDASMDATLDALVGTGFSAAGQRCTAISTVIFVGGSKSWEDKLVSRAKALKVGAGIEPDVDIGPVISKQAKEKICKLIHLAVDCGARLVLDGRLITVPNYEQGNFIGPTILCDVTNNMACYKEEFAGPILLCMQADSLDEAISIVNKYKYGIGASIFTKSSIAARKFQTEVEAGQVGINVPVPAPLTFFSLTGSEASLSADLNFYGKSGVHFYTQIKTVTQQWKDFDRGDATSSVTPLSNVPDCGDISLALPSNDFPSADFFSPALQSNNCQGIDGMEESEDGDRDGMQSNDYEDRDREGIQLNDFQCRDGTQSNDLRSMDRVSLAMQSRGFDSNGTDAPTLQQKCPETNRVSMPLQFEDHQSRSGVSLTLHSNDFPSTDEERQQCQGPM
ncbi:methylmalonate-semialdehyde dehydrogenase [acylating], mitochondrial-like [Apium graveolens]|uniref:methylmalonate-semialdehyde dehydrogenase [acylating], mitochondrial-like n=1 Tax=Apium graveolens TaxID=4045 RepID=UPI003D797A67